MLRKIIVVLAVLLAGFLIFIATRPAAFVITRSAVIPATPDRVFALVNDFHVWNDWSPWAKMDPACKNTFDGPASGVGAKFGWSGNNSVGEGRMEITESKPNDSIKLDLIFVRPMEGKNLTVFTFKPEGSGTRVTWTMSGDNNFIGKLFSFVLNCDKMVGGQFEQGFDNMKAKVASTPKA